MNIPEHTITLAVAHILNTRDFCGGERAVVHELAVENGFDRKTEAKLFRIAKFRANAEWRQWQRRAGVPERHIW
jgi:hypothetical protein